MSFTYLSSSLMHPRITVPSSMFPLSREETLFNATNQPELVLPEDFTDWLDNKAIIDMGKCYTNAHKIVSAGKKFDMKIEYYAGWVVIGKSTPIHHAWGVWNGGVIDASLSITDSIAWEKVNKSYQQIAKTGVPTIHFKAAYAEELMKEEYQNLPRSQTIHLGRRIRKDMTYIGCPSNREEARKLFNDAIKSNPYHPQGLHLARAKQGKKATMQELLDKKGYKL